MLASSRIASPASTSPALDERPALADEGQDLRVAVAGASGDVVRALELREGAVDVSLREERGDSARQREIPVLRCLGQPVQQALGVREPAARDGERAPVHVIPGEREREPGRAELVARGREARVRALAQRDRLVEPSRPPGRVREALEVVRRQVGLVRRPSRRRTPRARSGVRQLDVRRRPGRSLATTYLAPASEKEPATCPCGRSGRRRHLGEPAHAAAHVPRTPRSPPARP